MNRPPASSPPVSANAGVAANPAHSSSLLDLLNFSGSGAQGSSSQRHHQQYQHPHQLQLQRQQQQPYPAYQQQSSLEQQPSQFGADQKSDFSTARLHQPAPAGADPTGLLAALMKNNPQRSEEARRGESASSAQQQQSLPVKPFSRISPSAESRNQLLELLNRPKPSQADQARSMQVSHADGQTPQPSDTADDARHFLHQYQSPTSSVYQPAQPWQPVQPYQHHPSLSRQQSGQFSSANNPFPAPDAPPLSGTDQLLDQLIGSLNFSPTQHQDALVPDANAPIAHLNTSNLPANAAQTVADLTSDSFDQIDQKARQDQHDTEQSIAHDFSAESSQPKDVIDDQVAAIVASDDTSKAFENGVGGSSKIITKPAPIEPINTPKSVVKASSGSPYVAEDWEIADQEETLAGEKPTPVPVYNLPLKPWVSFTLQQDSSKLCIRFREESIMDIARLKKEQDQVDRNLYTASQTYMTYGMSKQGGLRVIRQDDGKDAKVFTDTRDRIFNVAMAVSQDDCSPQKEAIIGTGISGTIYWVQIKDGDKDHIDDTHLEQFGFALPPLPTRDAENVANGSLRTRARPSSAHPEYFAFGRGRSIYFIWPNLVLQSNLFKKNVHDRVVDTEKLFKRSSLKIHVGKALKDFSFSEDDTTVVSLDKSGKVNFWDVRDITATREGCDPQAPLPKQDFVELKEPLMTLSTAAEGERNWPTSILLLDKQRPYQKCCALRYMLVGMKQNHSLQLWDLALRRPVQELHFPHSNDSDPLCSIMYHPATGMIVVGHPTRNSIYFVHLSAPKYNLKSASQADYLERLIAQDSFMPQPDSTAVLSGIREYSFANRGLLRSLDILCDPAMLQDTDEPTMFELYAMHSKGVVCLLIRQTELGWDKDNKVMHAVDAVKEGAVKLSALKYVQTIEGNQVGQAEHPYDTGRIANKDVLPPRLTPAPTPAPDSDDPSLRDLPTQASNKTPSFKEAQVEKADRKSRRKRGGNGKESDFSAEVTRIPVPALPSTASSAKNERSQGFSDGSENAAALSPAMLKSTVSGMETRLSSAVADTLNSTLGDLHAKIDDNARHRDVSFNQHQVKLLDMVSKVLNENTQTVLETLIHDQFADLVIPAVGDRASRAVKDLLHSKLQPNIASAVQKEIAHSLPQAVNAALRSSSLVDKIASQVASSISSKMQNELQATLTQSLQAAQRASNDLHAQHQERLQQLQAQHVTDSGKIDRLLAYFSRLGDTLSTLAASQSSLQADLLDLKQQSIPGPPPHALRVGGTPRGNSAFDHGASTGASYDASSQHGSLPQHPLPISRPQSYMVSPAHGHDLQSAGSSRIPAAQPSPANALAGAFANQTSRTESEIAPELSQRMQQIETAIHDGRLQEAIMRWIQSGNEKEIFRRCLSAYSPSRFNDLPPLLLLVVIATISKELKPNPRLKQEIDWIEMAIRAFGESLSGSNWWNQDRNKVMTSASQTMQLLIARLQPLSAGYNGSYPLDPFLANVDKGKVEWIVQSSQRILDCFGGLPPRE